jgi:hypothetical protein
MKSDQSKMSKNNFECEDSDDDKTENEEMDSQNFIKMMMMRSHYNSGLIKDPELDQLFGFEKTLREKEENWLKETKKKSSSYYSKNFKIKIYLTNITPLIYRIFTVSGDTTLHTLHDKILCPIMGWCRNFHGYYFQRLETFHETCRLNLPIKSIGAAYGPIQFEIQHFLLLFSSHSIDMSHASTYGIFLIDDKNVRVGDVIKRKGDKLIYNYDLGDNFKHKLVVQEVVDDEKNEIGIDLLEGKGACPNENGEGNYRFSKKLQILSNPKDPEYRETLLEVNESPNYGNIGEVFPVNDIQFFDLKKKKKLLQMALKSKESEMDARNMFGFSFGGKEIGNDAFTKKFIGSSNPKFSESVYKAPKKECEVCHKKGELKVCSRCRIVYYCSAECQKTAWKVHKNVCKKNIE